MNPLRYNQLLQASKKDWMSTLEALKVTAHTHASTSIYRHYLDVIMSGDADKIRAVAHTMTADKDVKIRGLFIAMEEQLRSHQAMIYLADNQKDQH